MKEPRRIEIDIAGLEEILQRSVMTDEDRAMLHAVIDTLAFMMLELERERVSVHRLQRLLFGKRTEKTRDVLGSTTDGSQSPAAGAGSNGGQSGGAEAPPAPGSGDPAGDATHPPAADSGGRPPKRKGHGRIAASAYRGAERIRIPHASLHHGDKCPKCEKGKLRELPVPKRLVRIRGQAPIVAKLFELGRVRCDTCGTVFVADPPPGIGAQKYDLTTAVMVAMLRYGVGLPNERLARLEGSLGVPLPAGTQWDLLKPHLAGPEAVFQELRRQAAQADLLHNDDTDAIVLTLLARNKQIKQSTAPQSKKERTGIFTSSIVAVQDGRRIVLFFTGRQHAGENLADVLQHRATGLDPPLQMCDALSRNLPKQFQTILCNCLGHGRREFVDLVDRHRDECRHVLETLRDVYRFDELARKQNLSAEARLAWHQEHSAPLMNDLAQWFQAQFDEKVVEPNSALGGAIKYMQKHWHALTQFLRVAGAPLDNNLVERALKRAILHRRNSLFFRTEHGAHVGDVFMSLIHTAELCGANPIDYLQALMANAEHVVACPSQWLPWNYQQAVASAAA